MEVPALRYDLSNSYGLDLPETATIEALEAILAQRIDTLINNDFNRLIQLLYRIDVSEPNLRQILKQHPTADGSALIARLILERLWQKIVTRKMSGSNIPKQKGQSDPDEEERW